MMLRIAFLVMALAAAGFVLWRRFKPDPLLDVPGTWKRLARGHSSVREAIKLRDSLIKLALNSTAADAQPLALDVDRLVDSIASMCEAQGQLRDQVASFDPNSERARELRNSVADIEKAVRDALDQLHELHLHLVRVTSAEIDAAVADVRKRLVARRNDLSYVIEGHKEVETMLDDS